MTSKPAGSTSAPASLTARNTIPEQRPGSPELGGILQSATLIEPWALQRTSYAFTFRGRFRRGDAHLAAAPLPNLHRGITFGLASTPLVLKGVGSSFPVPANTPWAVPAAGAWRVVFSQTTDLRLIHCDAANLQVVRPGPGQRPAPLGSPHRPLRFDGPERQVMRAAIKSATAVWIDDKSRPIINLASSVPEVNGAVTVRPVGSSIDRDTMAAFVLMATWVLDQHLHSADHRLERVLEHIESCISDPGLTTASVAAHTRLSRRTLQGLFAEHGGLATVIRRKRLERVVQLLTADPKHCPSLDDVARSTGLGSRRTVERAMRQVYGLTAQQARSQVLAGYALREVGTTELKAS